MLVRYRTIFGRYWMEARIGLEIIILSNILKRNFESKIDKSMPFDNDSPRLSISNILIMNYLYENMGKNIYQKDIEEHFSLRASTVSANLRLMEKKGLIKRIQDADDTRYKKVVLGERGIMHEEKCSVAEEELRNILTAEEQESLLKIINKLKKEIK
jgi:DNA-binding MarR family transcriptional regulator